MNKSLFKQKISLLAIVLMIGFVFACNEYSLKPRMYFELEYAVESTSFIAEGTVVLKKFNLENLGSISIAALRLEDTEISNYTISKSGTHIEISFPLPEDMKNYKYISVVADSPEREKGTAFFYF